MAWKLLFIILSPCPGFSSLSIFQPPRIQAQEGGSVSLSCLFNISQEGPAIGFATWYLDVVAPGREVNNKTLEFGGRLVFSDQTQFIWDRMVKLQIQDIRASDAGLYLCKVEILGSGIGTGEGTRLVVMEGERSPWPKVFPLFLRAALYILSLVFVQIGTALYYKRQVAIIAKGHQSALKMRCDTRNFPRESQ
ncbi:natural cytotoxicity triggering receptor 3 [Trichosurus vulpecula]|uniref:natural cytotoxicity triggering receptor 3 n=1 Tax=Trichosurus vulpecula TaxID=9337 RepID=UPI00186AC6C9|nr:natural cytotoxicity triggering receptor 3 [Trichosurus vulpecula]